MSDLESGSRVRDRPASGDSTGGRADLAVAVRVGTPAPDVGEVCRSCGSGRYSTAEGEHVVHRALQTIRAVLLAFGLRGLLRRLAYVALLRSGWLRRRLPRQDDYKQTVPVPWNYELGVPNLEHCEDDVVARAEALLEGQLRFYGWTDREVGWPPRWHRNVFTCHEYPTVHWTSISDDDPAVGDIKDVWEPSRFTWVFLVARAWARTGDNRWPEAFWDGLESWMEHNPPNTGVNWRCGQESSLRAIAVQFGVAVFGAHPSTTTARRRRARQLLEATRQRVRPTVGYALSQRNNHAISELCFLLTLTPDDRRLNRLLRECIADQFYADGSHSQQSPTYQRLAVHTLLWLDQVTSLHPRTKAAIDVALERSGLFLARIVDPVSSHAPNYGPNDGALLLDLDATARSDFAPTLDLLGIGGGSSESAAWLGRRDTPDPGRVSKASTYVTLTVDEVHVLMRCGTGRHRPAHDDQLAVDVWMHGENVIPDAGTYRYTAPAPWGNALTSAEVHARTRLKGHAPTRIGRFLTAPVPAATLSARHEQDGAIGVTAELQTEQGALRRTVCADAAGVSILDETSHGPALGRITHAIPATPPVQVEAPQQEELTPVDGDPTSGWISPHYGQRVACGATDYEFQAGEPARTTAGRASSARNGLLDAVAPQGESSRPPSGAA